MGTCNVIIHYTAFDVLDNIEFDVPTMLVHLALFVRSQHRDTNELLLVH